MKSTIEPVEAADEAPAKKLVKLSVTVDPDEFDRDVDQAFRKIAREVKLPGFRAGKAPRRVLEARIGISAAREQALRDAVPVYLSNAVREHDVDLIATPEISITSGTEEGPVEFDATCEVRPEVAVPGYGGLRVELPNITAAESDIDAAVTTEVRRHGALADVERAIQSGDHVTLTLAATRDGEAVPGLNTEGWLYEVGQGWVAPGFDGELLGASVGDELTFTAVPNGTSEEADFTVNVEKVQEMVLPEVDDAWVSENIGEFDTVDEWRASLADKLGTQRLNQARSQFVERATEALVGLVETDAPEAMVSGDLSARVQNTVQRFQEQGISLDQWLQATGQDPGSFVEALKEQSTRAAKLDLALRAVAAAEQLTMDDDDLNAEYARIALQVGQKASAVRKAYEAEDAVAELGAQIRKTKALDWLLEHVEVVDADGNPIDRALLLDRDHAGHDHDHDHAGHDHEGHDHSHDDHDHGHAEHDHDHDGHDHDHQH
ncbi:MAG: tig [Ilumatobacteraceae bacterium]|nr:tig [Ilumatobacteraceae bacterium]